MMNILKYSLDQLENRLQSLIEGSTAKFFPGYSSTGDLAHQLVEAMRQGIQTAPDGALAAPGQLILQAHPIQAQALQATPGLLGELGAILTQAGVEAGVPFLEAPSIQVEAVSYLSEGMIRVVAEPLSKKTSQTETLDIAPQATDDAITDAYLVINGTQRFPLDHSVINIGRQAGNHLVIGDPGVSRRHAQLRLIRGQFVIFDLQSSGGVWVKGQRVNQWSLTPGDVILLANIPLLYQHKTVELGKTQDIPSQRSGD